MAHKEPSITVGLETYVVITFGDIHVDPPVTGKVRVELFALAEALKMPTLKPPTGADAILTFPETSKGRFDAAFTMEQLRNFLKAISRMVQQRFGDKNWLKRKIETPPDAIQTAIESLLARVNQIEHPNGGEQQ